MVSERVWHASQQQLGEPPASTSSDNDQVGILFGGDPVEPLSGLSVSEPGSMLGASVAQSLHPLLEHLAVCRSHDFNRLLQCCESCRGKMLWPEVENVHRDDLRVEERCILDTPTESRGGSRRTVESEHDMSPGHAVSLRRSSPPGQGPTSLITDDRSDERECEGGSWFASMTGALASGVSDRGVGFRLDCAQDCEEIRLMDEQPEPREVVFEELDRAECVRLLAGATLGRIAVAVPNWSFPVIRPVNFVFDESMNAVVFRSMRGSKLTALLLSHAAAFEVDGADELAKEGWSVIVAGRVEEIERRDRLGTRRTLGSGAMGSRSQAALAPHQNRNGDGPAHSATLICFCHTA